jgi:transcription initiation factor TFIIH subunit 1
VSERFSFQPARPNVPDHFKTAFAQLDLDDLHDPESSTAIPLEMQDRERYFEGRMTSQVSTTDAQSQVDFLPGFSTESGSQASL